VDFPTLQYSKIPVWVFQSVKAYVIIAVLMTNDAMLLQSSVNLVIFTFKLLYIRIIILMYDKR